MSKSFKKDLTGQRFGRLVVLEFVPTEDKYSYWKCRCDCGNIITVRNSHILSGHTNSCGCLQKQKLRERLTTHNLTDTRLYRIWHNMKQRCYNYNHNSYNSYGGRGIKICDTWIDDFQAFYEWAMSNGYKDNLSIDRIDNNGDYEPSNCRWTDKVIQSRNKRTNTIVKYKGKDMCITDAANLSGISVKTLMARYHQYGDRGNRLFRPVSPHKKYKGTKK